MKRTLTAIAIVLVALIVGVAGGVGVTRLGSLTDEQRAADAVNDLQAQAIVAQSADIEALRAQLEAMGVEPVVPSQTGSPVVIIERGEDGTDGQDGTDGRDGQDGADSTVPGPAGADGADGRDGRDSTVPGPAGADGQSIAGPTGPTGPQGEPGPQGPQGFEGPAPFSLTFWFQDGTTVVCTDPDQDRRYDCPEADNAEGT